MVRASPLGRTRSLDKVEAHHSILVLEKDQHPGCHIRRLGGEDGHAGHLGICKEMEAETRAEGESRWGGKER